VLDQERGGRRERVAGRFLVQGRRIAFDVGAYDRDRPLVIDPVVSYSTYLGGPGSETGRGIAVDAAGNIYAVVSGLGVVKLSADGSRMLYSTVLGDAALSHIAVDAAGRAYVAGDFPKPRSGFTGVYPVTPNALQSTFGAACNQGDSDGVMATLSPDGSQLIYSSFVGGRCSYGVSSIAVDATGKVYVTGIGSTTSDYPATRLPFAPSPTSAGFPGFIQVIAADYSRYVYSVLLLAADGGSVQPGAITTDAAGNAYLAGTASPGLPTTAGALQPTAAAGAAFVAKIAADGSRLTYATYLGNASTVVNAITVDGTGSAYVAGFARAGLPTVSALQGSVAGATDAFVAKLDAAGSALVFSTYLGGAADDAAVDVRLDGAGNVYIAGPTDSTNFPQRNALPAQFGAPGSNFVAALTPTGAALVYSTYFGDAQTSVEALTVTSGGTAYLTGGIASTGLATVRPLQPMSGGGIDAFIARIDPGGAAGTIRVFITAPAEGASVSGTVWLTVWIENAAAGARTLTLGEGGTTLSTMTVTGNGPLSVPWTPGGASGSRTLTVTVRDGAGNTGTASRTLQVQGGGGGGTAPLSAAFTSPAAGATVGGVVSVGLSAANASAPITFTLAVDGRQVFTSAGTATTASFSWNTAGLTGTHSLALTVRDGAGRTATATRSVVVAATSGEVRVFITAPGAGTTVSGTTWLAVWLENVAAGSKTLTLSEGGKPLGSTSTTSNGPISLPWVTTGGLDGSRTVAVAVTDAAGKTGTATRTVNVQNGTGGGGGGGDGTLRVFITQPGAGSTIRGTTWFTIWVEGAAAGSKTFTLTGTSTTVATMTSTSAGPISLAWPTTAADNGQRTASVTVRDAGGHTGTASISLTVAN
jgi:hypothetical protein